MLKDERVYPEPQEFKPERFLKNGVLDSSVRDPMDIAFGFGRRWALFILPLVHVSLSNVQFIAILIEFAQGNILLIQVSHSLLRPFCPLLTWQKKWMRMVGKLSPRGNILELGCGKLHFQSWLSSSCLLNVIYRQPFNFPCTIKPRSRYTSDLIRSSSGLELFE